MGIYARVLSVLGMVERLGELADVRSDALGLELEADQLPKRIRLPRRRDGPPRRRGDETWLAHPQRFALEPALTLGPGAFLIERTV